MKSALNLNTYTARFFISAPFHTDKVLRDLLEDKLPPHFR